MSDDFFADDAEAGAADGNGDDAYVLDLSEADLTDGAFKEIPVGTWLHLKFYDVSPGMVKSGNNYGKPKYQISFMTQDDDTEWGESRKFTVFANLFGKAFFIAYPILRAVGLAPTKEAVRIGAFFSKEYEDEFPVELAGIFTDPKRIPKGAYIMPSPKQLIGLGLYGKVGEYTGDNSGFKRFTSPAQALAFKDDDGIPVNSRAYPQLTEFMSEELFAEKMAGQSKSMSTFKGEE